MKKRPQKCCHPDCQNCPYKDCRWDAVSSQEAVASESFDRKIKSERQISDKWKEKEAQDKYRFSEKGKNTRKRYMETDGYAKSQERYRKSEKGMSANRERAMRYYERKSEEIGRPLSTVKEHLQKYGVDMRRGEFIGKVHAGGRISIPKRFREKMGLNDGEEFVIYMDRNGKLVIIGIESARKITENTRNKLEKYGSKY